MKKSFSLSFDLDLVSTFDCDNDFKVVEAVAFSYDWFLVAMPFAPEIVKSEEMPSKAIIYKFYLIFFNLNNLTKNK